MDQLSRCAQRAWPRTLGAAFAAIAVSASLAASLPASQEGTWTWVSGIPHRSFYGTRGVPSPENSPGDRYQATFWTGRDGAFWLLGGRGSGANSAGFLNDLWKWDGTRWTWISGSTQANEAGTYGALGEASPMNTPGARASAASWTDASGNLWLFGGTGYAQDSETAGLLNDLWKFDGTTWTWMSGSTAPSAKGIAFFKGVTDSENVPGAREGAASWADPKGNLWLFGGSGIGTTSTGTLNDLWKWDGANWTWVSGSNDPYELGVYGSLGVPASTNVPGARTTPASWIDVSGSFWLFGGAVYEGEGHGMRNDLWKWDGKSWTWVSGSTALDAQGSFGTRGTPSPANVPGARTGAASWADPSGSLWLLGGQAKTPGGEGWLDDLWTWDGKNWTWVGGTSGLNRRASYGTIGVPSAANTPGARAYASSWGPAGKLWLFGGEIPGITAPADLSNDLWAFTPEEADTLSLVGGRFRISADYADYGGGRGRAKAVPLTSDTGYFWFFGASNVEAVVKMVSFCGGGSKDIAIYAGGLTDLDVTFHVTDTASGVGRDYRNPLGTPFGLIRDGGFPCSAAAATLDALPPAAPAAPSALPDSCAQDASTLCLQGGRYQLRAAYRDYGGGSGAGHAVPLTQDTGTFWFFDVKNVEVVAKMVSFCGSPTKNVAVYAGGLTDLMVTLTVTDAKTGLSRSYTNPLGTPFQLIRDGPFTCP